MPADRMALTIVTAFLGSVMLGFWIAHACALYHSQRPIPAPQLHIGTLSVQIGSGPK
jgi:hypothetical protein